MSLCAVVLAAALTRAEVIARFKNPPLTKVSGLVQVVADCPADMRLEYQAPISRFTADICNNLYRADRLQPKPFKEPGIVIYLGSCRTNDTRVTVRTDTRDSGALFTRIHLPAPAYSDLDALRTEVVRAYFRAVKKEEIDADAARKAIYRADPDLKADYEYDQIERWLRGERVDGSDEEMLRLCRAIIVPGVARESDVLRFASRLRLYPESFDQPFCGRYASLAFDEAIQHLDVDPRLRLHAYLKAPQVVLFGGGRGEALSAAAEAYSQLLLDMAQFKKSKDELLEQLEAADAKLNIALEEARQREEGQTK